MTSELRKPAYESPFIAPDAPTLADAIERLDAVESLSLTARRDLKSALRRIAALIGSPAERTPANVNWLHIRLRRVEPALHGISKKSFANVKSAALRALRLLGCSRARADWLAAPSADWAALLEGVPDRRDQWKLSQLARYCSALDVEPPDVADSHIVGLHAALIKESFTAHPEIIAANAVMVWNRLRQTREGWPDVALSPPPRAKEPWTFPLTAFPAAFQEDVGRWLERLRNPDLFDENGPARPLKPTTIKHRAFQIRELASALVRSGTRMEEVVGLATLVELSSLKAALRWIMGRFDGQPTEAIHGVAICALAIARHHVKAPVEQIEAIKGIGRRLNREADGLRDKNRRRLLQFDDSYNLARLLHLPAALVERSRQIQNRKPRKAALMIQAAVAIEILLYAPLRVGNLAALDLVRHIKMAGSGRSATTLLHIPAEEVKNGKPLDHELGADATNLLQVYLRDARPQLLDAPSDCLFPALDGGPKGATALSRLIKDSIRDEAGLDVNAHLFRSIAGKIHSLAAPGDVVTLSHVLNDTLKTALKAYAQFERRSALEHYQRSVDAARRRASLKRSA